MEYKSEMKFLLDEIEQTKQQNVARLIDLILNSDDPKVSHEAAFLLVDNFRDERIEDCLISIINDPRWKNRNGTFLFLLGEYTNSSKYLYYLIELIFNNLDDGEIFMGAYGMIIDMQVPLDEKEIHRTIKLLKNEEKKAKKESNKRKKKITDSLLNYLEGQIDICEFYKQFG